MIIDLFEECTQQYPSNSALILEDGASLNYSNLYKLSSKIQQLVYQIVKKTKNNDDSSTPLIAVMTDRNISFIVSMLGILSAGAAYVPVDPSFPPDRQVHIFNHSQCEFLIIDDTSFDAAVSLGVTLPPLIKMDSNGNILEITIPGVSLDGFHDPAEIIKYRKTNGSERLAYVLYTSGSTGKPKGVMVKNIGVVNIVSWFADQIGVTSKTRVMGLTTFCFDISVLEMCMPLIRGGALVLGKTASQKDPFTLLEVIKRLSVTVFQATPTTYEMMMATGWKGDSSIDFLVGGEAFRPTLLPLASTCRSLRNVYGPTETTIWSTSYTVTQSWVEQQLSKTNTSVAVPIGDAISETSLYLVTEQQPYKEVGYYEEGELWIGGVGVATGYLHSPDLTEQRFLKNPFGEGFVYRTGDVVKRLQDGTNQYIFVRRMDDQVKIGGFRIELQEIEVVYGRHPSVEQAVALVRDNKLVVYLKLAAGVVSSTSLLSDIRTASSRSLTYYMMPKSTVVVDSFPQTANGKLDRKALPDPPASADEGDDIGSEANQPVPEASKVLSDDLTDSKIKGVELTTMGTRKQYLLAQHICDIVNTVRGRRPGINASFAAIGVDSLGAIVLVRQLTDSFGGYRVPPTTLFAPGMSAYKLAGVLLPILRKEKPEILKRIGVDSYDVENGNGLEDITTKSGDDSQDIYAMNEEDQDEPSEFDTQFDTAIALSRDYLEGIRGFFAFMVLWDHYSPVQNSLAWLSDVNLFILISGVATSLQLRTPPRYIKSATNEKQLLPRPHFNLTNFLLTRAIGIFPIYYIALLLCTPAWIALSGPYKGKCVPLYVLNLDAWWRPACHTYGPNYVEFASVVWSMFLIYGILRAAFSVYQNWVLRKYPNTRMSALMTELMYNRIDDRPFAYAWVFFLSVIVIGLLVVARFTTFSLTPPVYLPYIFAGVVAVNALECFAYVHGWFPTPAKDSETSPSSIPEGSNWHWYKLRSIIKDIYDQGSSYRGVSQRSDHSDVLNTEHKTVLQQTLALLWQFSPDLLVICAGVQLANTFKGLRNTDYSNQVTVELFSLPLTFLVLIIIGIMQYGNSRLNFSRFVFANPIMGLLGYCSFAIYLFQRIIIDWYVREYFGPGFNFTALWQRFIIVLIVILFSWLVQHFVVDTMSVFLFKRMMKYNK